MSLPDRFTSFELGGDNDEIIRNYRYCGHPLVEELCRRLDEAQIEIYDLEQTFIPEADLPEDCDECGRLQEEIDSLEDDLSGKDEEIEHLNNRIDEFHDENLQLREKLDGVLNSLSKSGDRNASPSI